MTGSMLRHKKEAFDIAVDAPEDDEREPLGKTNRHGGIRARLDRFLKVSIVFLGSLNKAIPLLELVKEYKDTFEAGMGYPEK